MSETRFTVYCKLPNDKRGEYSEEIDIICSDRLGDAAIKRAAQNIIDEFYDLKLRPVRVVRSGVITVQSFTTDTTSPR